MKCQFCGKVYRGDQNDLQIHQASECPAIQNEEFVKSKPIEVYFGWCAEELSALYPSTQSVHIILSDMNDQIELVSEGRQFISQKTKIQPGEYTGQLILEGNFLPFIIDIQDSNEMSTIYITTMQNEGSNEEETEPPPPQKEKQNVPENEEGIASRGNGVQHGEVYPAISLQTISMDVKSLQTTSMDVETINTHSTGGNLSHKENMCNIITTDYTLNKQRALTKKMNALGRIPYEIDHRNDCMVITFNTVNFESFRGMIAEYLESKGYKIATSKKQDNAGSIPEDILRVYDKQALPIYTINIYRTTSRVMVNGPKFNNFIVDFPFKKSSMEVQGYLDYKPGVGKKRRYTTDKWEKTIITRSTAAKNTNKGILVKSTALEEMETDNTLACGQKMVEDARSVDTSCNNAPQLKLTEDSVSIGPKEETNITKSDDAQLDGIDNNSLPDTETKQERGHEKINCANFDSNLNPSYRQSSTDFTCKEVLDESRNHSNHEPYESGINNVKDCTVFETLDDMLSRINDNNKSVNETEPNQSSITMELDQVPSSIVDNITIESFTGENETDIHEHLQNTEPKEHNHNLSNSVNPATNDDLDTFL